LEQDAQENQARLVAAYLIRRTSMKVMLIALIVLALMSCDSVGPGSENIPENQSAQWSKLGDMVDGTGMYRYTDSQAGVVCWVYIEDRAAGLSCLPIDQTGSKQ
jgi:hypothetical protein